jgi:hypothetical protein
MGQSGGTAVNGMFISFCECWLQYPFLLLLPLRREEAEWQDGLTLRAKRSANVQIELCNLNK